MKILTTILKIIAIVLNILLLTTLVTLVAKSQLYIEGSVELAMTIVGFICPAVTLITLILMVFRKIRSCTSTLKVLAFILNIFVLAGFFGYCLARPDRMQMDAAQWLYVSIIFLSPFAVSALAIGLTFRREDEPG